MSFSDKIDIVQTVILGLTFFVTVIVGYFAWLIGERQNNIAKKQNEISDFVEVFIMPQQVLYQDEEGNQKLKHWNLLVKNASAYPIYLKELTLNGVNHEIGNSAIPSNPESWHALPIPSDVQNKGELSLITYFEDYLGKNYKTESYGEFRNHVWNIRSEKKERINK